jgi:hypothetical protein
MGNDNKMPPLKKQDWHDLLAVISIFLLFLWFIYEVIKWVWWAK